MKVLFIAGSGLGGSNLSLKNLIIGLQRIGIDICLVVPNDITKKVFSDIITPEVVPYRDHAWPVLKGIYDYFLFIPRVVGYSLMNILAFYKLKKITEMVAPNIIHTNTSVVKIGYQVAKKLSIPHVWHVREYINEDFNIRVFPTYKRYVETLKKENTISISRDIKEHFCFEDSKPLIYNGIFDADIKSHSINVKNENFLYVGAITQKKGVNMLIEGFIIYCKMGGKSDIFLAGDGPTAFKEQLKSIINATDYSQRVHFLGRRNDVAQLMASSKCLIVPSYREAFGRITAEAMINGCLVLGRNTGGTKEQLDLGKQYIGEEIGFRFSNAEELSELLISLDSDRDFSKMVANAQKVAMAHYSLQANASNVLNYYKKFM